MRRSDDDTANGDDPDCADAAASGRRRMIEIRARAFVLTFY